MLRHWNAPTTKNASLSPQTRTMFTAMWFENIGFSYSTDKVVLREISLHAKPGEMVALVGPTSCGEIHVGEFVAGVL